MLEESAEACKEYMDDYTLAISVVFNLTKALIEIEE